MSYQFAPPPAFDGPGNGPVRSERIEPAALIAFLLALSSLLIPVFPAINALALIPGARRNIEASNGLRSGNGLTIAAAIISVVTLLVTLVIGLLLIL